MFFSLSSSVSKIIIVYGSITFIGSYFILRLEIVRDIQYTMVMSNSKRIKQKQIKIRKLSILIRSSRGIKMFSSVDDILNRFDEEKIRELIEKAKKRKKTRISLSGPSEYKEYIDKIRKNKEILSIGTSYDDKRNLMQIYVITEEEDIEIEYPITLQDLFPNCETTDDILNALNEILYQSQEKIILDEEVHPLAMMRKLLIFIERLNYVEPISSLNEKYFEILIALMITLKEAFDTWYKKMLETIKEAHISYRIKKNRQ